MTNNLSIDALAPSQNNKTTTINDANGQIDAAITDILSTPITNTNAVTLSDDDLRRHFVFKFVDGSPAPTGTATVTVGAIARGLFYVDNALSTHMVQVTIAGQGPAPAQINAGVLAPVVSDGISARPG